MLGQSGFWHSPFQAVSGRQQLAEQATARPKGDDESTQQPSRSRGDQETDAFEVQMPRIERILPAEDLLASAAEF